MSTTLPLFWHLSSVTKKERIDASIKLVSTLEQFQIQFTQKAVPAPTTDDEDEEESAPKSDGLDLMNAQDVSYSIRRLVRGLASSREQSRLGFAVAFTEVCDALWYLEIVSILLTVFYYLAAIAIKYGDMLSNNELD